LVHLRQLLGNASGEGRLDRAALDVAAIHDPDLDPEPCLAELNQLASALGDRLRNFNDGRDFVEKAQSYLFGEAGFHGNDAEYFDPRNSCLNQVLARRTGLPIALSVLYLEISRRLHMPVFGVDLPRHFVVQFDDGRYSTYIDPFHGGKIITAQECFALAQEPEGRASLLQRSTKKRIIMRMLRNLLHSYLRSKDFARAVTTLNFLLEGSPDVPEWYRQRGALEIQRKRYQAARTDLERYLAMAPLAPDREEIVRQLEEIHRWLGRIN
jgi:regulator of sirC expression with transglutaminase-like and TPR domain